jgi:hypothetical protein
VFLHPVVSAGHVVYFGAFRASNVDEVFFMSGGPSAVSLKRVPRHITPNL